MEIRRLSNDSNSFFAKKNWLWLGIIGIISLLMRLYLFPIDVPFEKDVLDLFGYAVTSSNFGNIPENWFLANNGWPLFLSLFFSVLPIESFFEHVYLQRIISIIISTVTIIPIYLFCKKFFNENIAIIGSALFAFNPIIIDFSIYANSYSLFLLVGITLFYYFLRNDIKSIYISFFLLGILSIIRYEALLLLVPITALYFIKFRKEKKVFLKYIISISFLIIIILPFSINDYQNFEQDGLISNYFVNTKHVELHIIQEKYSGDDWTDDVEENVLIAFFQKGFENLLRIGFISLIPIFLFLIPYGIYRNVRNINFQKLFIIFISITLLIPSFYAYSRDFQDVKYLLMLFPVYSILSLYTIEKIHMKIKRVNLTNLALIIIIFSSSILILQIDQIDYSHEKEAFLIAQKVVELSDGYNIYEPESRYIKTAEMMEKWPEIAKSDGHGHLTRETERINDLDFDTLEEFLNNSKNKGLTHLVVDEKNNRPEFFTNVFNNENKFPYLIKEYDSANDGFGYKVKIFKIDYKILTKLEI